MTPQQLIEKIKSLDLPEGEYIVFGSAALAVRGIRECKDVDVVVSQQVYDDLKSKGWREKTLGDGRKILEKDLFEVGVGWNYGAYNPLLPELLERADVVDDVPFASLPDIIAWKRAFGREKDKDDIELIENYLRRKS